MLAGVLGFEPRVSVPKTDALPLGDTPTLTIEVYKIVRKKATEK